MKYFSDSTKIYDRKIHRTLLTNNSFKIWCIIITSMNKCIKYFNKTLDSLWYMSVITLLTYSVQMPVHHRHIFLYLPDCSNVEGSLNTRRSGRHTTHQMLPPSVLLLYNKLHDWLHNQMHSSITRNFTRHLTQSQCILFLDTYCSLVQ